MSWLQGLIVKIKGDNKDLKKSLTESKQEVGRFGSSVKQIGGLIASAFATGAIVNFIAQAIKLGAQVEGIKKGFEQIASPGLLDDLRTATKGTVSDMQLMSRAVQASNFQIPLQDLAKLLEFASARAVQTGQSVDYLVDSIVLGIGRKSPLILDNLGISAIRLRELLKGPGVEMSGVGDVAKAVGKIAEEELKKMGGMAETAGTKIQGLSASWANFKTTIGENVLSSEIIRGILDASTEAVKRASADIPFWQKFWALVKNGAGPFGLSNQMTKEAIQGEYNRLGKLAMGNEGESSRPNVVNIADTRIETLASLNTQLEKEKKHLEEIDLADTKGFQNQRNIIKALQDRIDALTKLEVVQSKLERTTAPGKVTNLPSLQNVSISGIPQPQGIQDATTPLKDTMSKMEQILTEGRDMAADLSMQIVESLGQMFGGAKMKDVGKELLLSLSNFMAQFGKLLITLGLGMDAFVKSLKTMNPIIAITAGLALIAAAGAIKGLMDKGPSVGGHGGGSRGGNYTSSGSYATAQPERLVAKLRGKDIEIALRRI